MKSVSVCMMAAAALTTAVVAGPSFAQDYRDQHQDYHDQHQDYHDQHQDYRDQHQDYHDQHQEAYAYYQHQCEAQKHNRNLAGIGIGAVMGGLLGNAVSHGGGRTGGTVIGAAAGAAVGSNIARSTSHCKDGRPYWSYEQTVEYRAYAGYPGRYDDDWYGRRHCRWVQSERGWMRVCPGPNGYFYPEY